jgi:hypothetical protein
VQLAQSVVACPDLGIFAVLGFMAIRLDQGFSVGMCAGIVASCVFQSDAGLSPSLVSERGREQVEDGFDVQTRSSERGYLFAFVARPLEAVAFFFGFLEPPDRACFATGDRAVSASSSFTRLFFAMSR